MNQTGRPAVGSTEGEDQRLMAAVARGDVSAFPILYERYKAPVMSYAFHIVRSRPVAEEITQEVFLKVYRARESYTTEAKFTTWLWTIARNTSLDYVRRRRELPLDEGQADARLAADTPPESLSPAEEALMERATRERLEACLGRLPDAHREALVLRTFSELSYDEIASLMNVPVSSVKNYLHRAKAQLVKWLREGGEP